MRLSLRDSKNKKKFINNEKMWQYSEKVLKEAMKESGLPHQVGIGEAAFSGPKVDFQVKNVVGKEYSASTNQLDFAAGLRFNLDFCWMTFHFSGLSSLQHPVLPFSCSLWDERYFCEWMRYSSLCAWKYAFWYCLFPSDVFIF